MAADAGKLIVGLAAAVGVALLAFARKHGAEVDLPELPEGADPIERAELELERWSGLKETDARAAPLLARYWAAVGLPPQAPSVPWSAAFISFVAKPGVAPSGNHVGYGRAALKARQAHAPGVYWAFRPEELTGGVQAGDILLRGRGEPVGWQDLATDTGHKDAHGDLVTSTLGGILTSIGGNVSNAVTRQQVPFSGAAPAGVFAVLRKPSTVGGVV